MIQNTKIFVACLMGSLLANVLVTGTAHAQLFPAPQSNTQQGARLGGIAGAIIGGIAGHQNDETLGGVAIGGAVGALAGGLAGKSQDRMQFEQQQYQQQAQQVYQERVGRAVSLEDAVMLTRSGVSPNLIINQINDHGVTHRLVVSDIIQLHQNGVSEAVITTMQSARLASQPNSPVIVSHAPTPVIVQRQAVVVQPVPSVSTIQFYSRPRPSHPPRGGGRYHHPRGW